MKTTLYVTYAVSLLLICACAAGETETLKQARAIQNEILSSIVQLDSSFASYTNQLNGEISALSADTMLQEDTLLLKTYNTSKTNLDNAYLAHAEIENWKSTMKLLPSMEEIAQGDANPFGEGKTDEEALIGMKKQNEDLAALTKKLSELIHQ